MGLGASKKLKVGYEKPRESEDTTTAVKKWLECSRFDVLPEDGRIEFIEYAEKHCSRDDTRRLKFWFKCPDEDNQLTSFLTEYLLGDEALSDVRELRRNNIGLTHVVENGSKVDGAIKIMKDSMRKDLNDCFKEFRKHLEERIKQKS